MLDNKYFRCRNCSASPEIMCRVPLISVLVNLIESSVVSNVGQQAVSFSSHLLFFRDEGVYRKSRDGGLVVEIEGKLQKQPRINTAVEALCKKFPRKVIFRDQTS